MPRAKAAAETTKPEETKNEAFRRIARMRVPRIVKDLKLVGNLATGSGYEYSGQEAEQVMDKIQKAVNELHGKFMGGASSEPADVFDDEEGS